MSRTTKWTSEGVPITVTTVQQPGETVAAWRARHEVKVAAALANFPPDANSMLRTSIWTSLGLAQHTTTRRGTLSYAAFIAAHDSDHDLDLGTHPPDLEAA